MESYSLLDEIEKISVGNNFKDLDLATIYEKSVELETDYFSIETAAGTEEIAEHLFQERNIPDEVIESYSLSMTDQSEIMSLYEKYLNKVDQGDANVGGLVSTLKGKIHEINLELRLEDKYPGYDFELAKNPTQPVWDLKGTSPEGEDILVQAKMVGENNASEIIGKMEDNPNVLFSVSKELKDKIVEANPELADQLVLSDVSNSELTDSVQENLAILADNAGIDIADQLGEVLPYVTELVLGIRLLIDIVRVERDFSKVDLDDRSRIHALKALSLFSRFGISATLTTLGGIAGTSANPGIGTAVGAITGGVTAGYLNKKLKPHMNEIAKKLSKVDDNELYYLRNKEFIDSLGTSFNLQAQKV